MKTEKRVNQRGFAGTVGTKQADGFSAQIAAQVFQNLPPAKRNAKTMQVDYWRLRVSRLSFDRFVRNRSGECHTVFITLCSDNSKRIRVRRLCPSAEKQQCMLTHLQVLKFCLLQETRSGTQVCLGQQRRREETAALVCSRPCAGEAMTGKAHRLTRTKALP